MRAPTTSWEWKVTRGPSKRRVAGLPTSWNRAANRNTRSGSVLSSTAKEWASTSLWRWSGSASMARAGISGMNSSAKPEAASPLIAAPAPGAVNSLDSSSRMRSGLTIRIRSAISPTASSSLEPGRKPSWAAKRKSRNIRNGSSEKETCGPSGVRSIFRAASAAPW